MEKGADLVVMNINTMTFVFMFMTPYLLPGSGLPVSCARITLRMADRTLARSGPCAQAPIFPLN